MHFNNGGQECIAFYINDSSSSYYDLGIFTTQKRIDFSKHTSTGTTLYWSITG